MITRATDQTVSYTLPAFWASAIVNNDRSGMSVEEIEALAHWRATHPELGNCLDCTDEAGFRWRHDAWPEVLGCDCLVYIFDFTGRKA